MLSPLPDYGVSFQTSTQTLLEETFTAEQHAERFIKEQISDPNYTHEINTAQLWAIKKDNSFHMIAIDSDVYELLSRKLILSTYLGVIIHTTGWAAPLEDDGSVGVSPSKHDARRRIALAACVMDSSVGSALSFADDKDIIIDPGSASGSLADALIQFWEQNKLNDK